MSKLCLIYNTAPLYRKAIFSAIDVEYDCDWYFGPKREDIQEMDFCMLKNVYRYKAVGNPNKFYFKIGILGLLFKKEYQNFFMLAEVRSVADWLFFLMASLFFPKKKIYIWTHGWYGKETRRNAMIKLWLYKHVTGSFVYSNYAREMLIKKGIPADKLFTVHNSLNYSEQIVLRNSIISSSVYKDHFGNNYPVIIFIGRLTKVKQLDILVDAVSDLKNNGENYNLVFVGDGMERAKLELRVEKLKLIDVVWFYGACYDEKENAELIYNADLCVAPGNVGLTAVHTMMFGTPVISHNDFKWQMPEFESINPCVTGDFFVRGDKHSLVEVISRWFNANSNKREIIRKACFNEIDTQWNPYFQMDVIKKNLELR